MRIIATLILFFGMLSQSLCADPHPYFVVTHPKGGTGLLIKALALIDGQKPINLFCHYDKRHYSPQMLEDFAKMGGLPVLHLFTPQFTYDYLMSHHLNYQVIVIIRDPRDAFVSYAFYSYHHLDIPIQQKISLVFKDKSYCNMSKHLSYFLNNPRFHVVRFEDLVGPKGGGDLERQKLTLCELSQVIGVELSDEKLANCCEELYGNSEGTPHSQTFRDGKIGSWQTYFTEEHKRLFKKKFNDELIRLGYVKDKTW